MTHDDFIPDEVHPGRRSRYCFTQTPQWALLLQSLSDAGYRTYSLLLAHVSTERDDALVWPHQQSLADMLGKRPEAVSRVVNKELVPLGLVDIGVKRYGANNSRRRNVYTVHEEPPEGWEGIASLQEWYAANKAKKSNAAGQPTHAKNRASGDTKDRAPGHAKNRAGNYTNAELDEGRRTGVADAVGKTAGGFARAGASSSTGGESHHAGSGSAASEEPILPTLRKTTSPRPTTTRTRPRKESPGFELVRDAIPITVAAPGTRLYPGLHRAINDLLNGNAGGGIPARTPEQIIARINRRWYGENAEERTATDYRGCDHCTPSGCQAPRRSEENPDSCDRINNPNSWLTTTILAQDCPDPGCEDGQIIGGGDCRACQERRHERQQAARAATEAEATWNAELADADARAATEAAVDDWKTAEAAEEHRLRSTLAQTGMWGTMLDHQVAQHMAGWRKRNPQPVSSAPVQRRADPHLDDQEQQATGYDQDDAANRPAPLRPPSTSCGRQNRPSSSWRWDA